MPEVNLKAVDKELLQFLQDGPGAMGSVVPGGSPN